VLSRCSAVEVVFKILGFLVLKNLKTHKSPNFIFFSFLFLKNTSSITLSHNKTSEFRTEQFASYRIII